MHLHQNNHYSLLFPLSPHFSLLTFHPPLNKSTKQSPFKHPRPLDTYINPELRRPLISTRSRSDNPYVRKPAAVRAR